MRRRAARRRPGRGYRADRAAVWRVLRALAEDARRREEWHRRLIVEDRAVRRQERKEDRALGRQEREADRALGRQERAEDRALARQEREEDRAAARQEREEGRALQRRALEEQLALLRHMGQAVLGAVQEGIREWNANREKGWRKIEKEIHRVIGDGDARWGRLMEALTEGDLPSILGEFGIEVTPPRRRMAATRGGYTREWDLVALGERASVVVEVKTTLRPEDVRLFRKRMEEFRLWMPDFDRDGMSIHGALAYLSADESVLRNAERRGFFLIRVVGSSASIRNPPDFAPAAF